MNHLHPDNDQIPDCTDLIRNVSDEPEKWFPTLHITAISFIDGDGKPNVSYHVLGERYMGATLALLEMLKVAIIRDAYGDDDE